MEEMCAEGSKTTPLSAARDGAAAEADRKVEVADDAKSYTLIRLFKDPELRLPLLIACALVTIQQFSGINAVRRFRVLTTAASCFQKKDL